MNTVFSVIEILGVFTFAISGALTAMKKKFDGFGIVIIAFVTAIGGGTLRDVLLNIRPFWLIDTSTIYVILMGIFLAIVFKSKIHLMYKPLMLFDAIGLGLFTVTGVQIGISNDLEMVNCIILGTMTGTFGGIIRDILVNQIPVIFEKEIYATISLFGGILYYGLYYTDLTPFLVKLIPVLFIITSRLLVIKFKLTLPSIYAKKDNQADSN